MSDDAPMVIVVETQSETGWRSMELKLPVGTWQLGELHELAKMAAETAGVLSEQSTEITLRVSFPAA